MNLSDEERKELEELRKFKREFEGKSLNRAFARLESLLESAHDPLISIRAFRVIGECLICLKEQLDD